MLFPFSRFPSSLPHVRRFAGSCLLLALGLGLGGGLGGCASQDDTNLTRVSRISEASRHARAATPKATPAPKSAPTPAVTQAPLDRAPLDQTLVAPQLPAAKAESAASGPDLSSMVRTKTQVAILLPLSGKQAALGQAMLNAAQLAVFDMGSGAFELMPRDTGGAPAQAATAAHEAIAGGARLLIGPLFAADVAAVKPVVQTSSVNMLALSTDVSLAEPGAYVMGFAPAAQVDRVVSFAAGQGAQRYGALIPATPYGKLVRHAFEEAVRRVGGTMVTIETPDKATALLAQKDHFDTLFLPLSAGELRQIAPTFRAAGITGASKRLLGTGLWDEPSFGQGFDFLVGGFYAASDPAARAAFIENYQKAYGKEPPRLATLAYDATALAAVLAAQGASFDRTMLSNPNGFAGVDGIFRLAPSGQAERGLAVLVLDQKDNQVVDPAPTRFGGL